MMYNGPPKLKCKNIFLLGEKRNMSKMRERIKRLMYKRKQLQN